jgi:hypothetical protein
MDSSICVARHKLPLSKRLSKCRGGILVGVKENTVDKSVTNSLVRSAIAMDKTTNKIENITSDQQ